MEVAWVKNAGQAAAGVGVAARKRLLFLPLPGGQCFGAWGGPENVVHPETWGAGEGQGLDNWARAGVAQFCSLAERLPGWLVIVRS